MCFSSAFFKPSRKVKFLVLVGFCVMILTWIATFGNVTNTVRDQPQLVKLMRSQKVVTEGLRNAEELEWGNRHPSPAPVATLQPCPALSPHLRGPLALSFMPSLTLAEVEQENAQVVEGQYEPADCQPRQSVAILIPHRSREKHLLYLLHHLHPFLQRQQLHYAIYIIHQAGNVKFNRAKLLNVGYLEALKDYKWDCFIFHDVDLVPENDLNLYVCNSQPKHLVVGRNATGYRLRYKGYFGGVTAMTREQFSKVNGFSNTYWGWGGEDDDLRIRVELQRMKIVRPSPEVARYTMIFHTRDNGNEVNKDRMRLLSRTSRVWKTDGLNSCTYKELSLERVPLYINVTVDIGKPPGHP
ncbi:beta-1,4-galactosyltransferase 4-like [Acipenser oxyrinchus oxyrinchus]|uniref:Beta-1,4-galactosyltransferase n=1 Tax=Acipenser oxyrinchus oxyrinchus TaxID=40147 RepID=A0AAD8DG46_ACIOX|nr:beta-1,4-galactosyltransferase 4-like [Acipenser oxyrinchus oxyrinchus]